MKVLIACEESQIECLAFRNEGHEAFSCDILPCSGGFPEYHIQDDVRNVLKYDWDLVVAHPPCTYLSVAGARWLYPNHVLNEERYKKGLAAKEFFLMFFELDCRFAIENPTPLKIFDLPKPSQVVQPYMFGDPFSKRTCLWLHRLPLLIPNYQVSDYEPYVSSSTKSGVSRSGGSSRVRSRAFVSMAREMAFQWTYFL